MYILIYLYIYTYIYIYVYCRFVSHNRPTAWARPTHTAPLRVAPLTLRPCPNAGRFIHRRLQTP